MQSRGNAARSPALALPAALVFACAAAVACGGPGRRPTDVGGWGPTDVEGRRPTDVGGSGPTDVGGRRPTDVEGRRPTDVGGRRPTDVGGAGAGAAQPGASSSGNLRWELAGKLPTLRRASARGRSTHKNGDLEADVLASAEAGSYPALGPSRAPRPGAILVQAHYAAGASAPSFLFAMVKHPPGFDPDGGDWEYLILDPGGAVHARGRLPLCARCHAEAPHDHLFGGPR